MATQNTNNAFIKLQEQANGRVSVKLQKNQFAKEGEQNFYGRVERVTYSTQNILDEMAQAIPLVNAGTIASVMNAYTKVMLKILANGNAPKFGELGTFYIAGKGTVSSETGKPDLTVKFSASQALKDAVQNIEIASSEYIAPSGVISSVTDISSGKSDGKLTAGGSVLVEGASLKVGGENSGIWFAPILEGTDSLSGESDWTKVESALIFNLPSKLLFALPQSLASGKYKIVVRTRYAGKSGYERKYLVETISETVEVA